MCAGDGAGNNIDKPALAFLPLMLPNLLGTASCTFYLTQYFKGIPDELIEAATIDGYNNIQTLIKVVLPLSKSIIAVMLIFYLVGYY